MSSWRTRAVCYLASFWWPLPLWAIEPVVVEGERERPPLVGPQAELRPERPSEFDSRAFFQGQSSFFAFDLGDPDQNQMPRIRGQENKMTGLYLNGVKIVDDLTGSAPEIPLDLWLFSEMQTYQGMTPPALPGLTFTGALALNLRKVAAKKTRVGMRYGEPYGLGLWSSYETPFHEGTDTVRIYGQSRQTRGSFPYYDNNGTPYETADDGTEKRRNNDRRSQEAAVSFEHQKTGQRWSLFLWHQKTEGGVASFSKRYPSLARESRSFDLLQQAGEVSLPHAAALRWGLGYEAQQSGLKDAGQDILFYGHETQVKAQTYRGEAHLDWRREGFKPTFGLTMHRSALTSRIDGAKAAGFSRLSFEEEAGVSAEWAEAFRLDLKETWQGNEDRFDDAPFSTVISAPPAHQRWLAAKGFGLGVTYQILSGHEVYGQIGTQERVPSLLEEFGNGGLVLENPELKSEFLRHEEIGFKARPEKGPWQLFLALFRDRGQDKIIFTRAMAEAMRAQNIDKTEILGGDLQLSSHLTGLTTQLGYTRLQPYNRTGGRKRILPGVPLHTVTLGFDARFGDWSVRSLSRSCSQIYLDSQESIIVPAFLVHDLFLDAALSKTVKIGITLANLTDVEKLPITTPQTGEKGATSYATSQGYPLPGRHGEVSVTAEF